MVAMSDKRDTSFTMISNVLKGGIIGASEVLLHHPLFINKVRMQKGLKPTLSPKIIYCGVLPNAVSMFPTAALQMSLNSWLQFQCCSPLSEAERSSIAFASGISSAVVACPTQRILIYQSEIKLSFFDTGKYLFNHKGWSSLYTGLAATAWREGVYSWCFLHMTPFIKGCLKKYDYAEHQAVFGAGIISGLVAALASQKIDTIKTTQQNTLHPRDMLCTMRYLYNERGGIKVFFSGGSMRSIRLMSAMTYMSWVDEKMGDLIRPQ